MGGTNSADLLHGHVVGSVGTSVYVAGFFFTVRRTSPLACQRPARAALTSFSWRWIPRLRPHPLWHPYQLVPVPSIVAHLTPHYCRSWRTSTTLRAANDKTFGHVDHHDLLNEVSKRLTSEEQILFAWRREGLSWNTIAERLSEDILLLRKRLSRALNRVAVELKLEEEDES